MKIFFLVFIAIFYIPSGFAEDNSAAKENNTAKNKAVESVNTSNMLGMSVIGNKESPRTLTIVPWREPTMNGESPNIKPVWQPVLQLLEPEAYRRDINLFLEQRAQKLKLYTPNPS